MEGVVCGKGWTGEGVADGERGEPQKIPSLDPGTSVLYSQPDRLLFGFPGTLFLALIRTNDPVITPGSYPLVAIFPVGLNQAAHRVRGCRIVRVGFFPKPTLPSLHYLCTIAAWRLPTQSFAMHKPR